MIWAVSDDWSGIYDVCILFGWTDLYHTTRLTMGGTFDGFGFTMHMPILFFIFKIELVSRLSQL